jgi:5-methylcytosine-specific restriction endonuclease McrA
MYFIIIQVIKQEVNSVFLAVPRKFLDLTLGYLRDIITTITILCQKIMAKNTNKRLAVKHVRDKAKSAYQKASECYICGTSQDLELHHFHSITLLLEAWASAKGYDISTDEGILAVREEFIEEHHTELYEKVRTLCNRHHVALHSVYGKAPPRGSEPKQERWVEIQRNKHQDTSANIVPVKSYGSFFSEFI